MTHVKWQARKLNRKGGIEGLPLELMIIIIIATMGTAILVGWMGNIETPHSIGGVDVETGTLGDSDITTQISLDGKGSTDAACIGVYVRDQDGNPLKGATVVLSGLNVAKTATDQATSTKTYSSAYATTDNNGLATLDNLHLALKGGSVGFVTVSVSMPGYGENTAAKVAVVA